MCHGAQAALYTPPSVPVTKMSSWSLLREIAVIGDPAAARPPLISRQSVHPVVCHGAHAAVIVRPCLSTAKMSSWSRLRDTAPIWPPWGR